MASQPRTSAREDERRHKLRTLVVASAASATAAVVISQFWIAGTWMAAALTPVLVTLLSELLHRPTTAIANRFTTEGDAVVPEAGGAGAPPRERDQALPARAPAEPGSGEAEPPAPPVRVYRAVGGRGPRSRRKIAVGAVAATAALAFAITVVALTGTELITGGSIGKGNHRTTLLGGGTDTGTKERDTTAPDGQGTDKRESKQPQQQHTTPDQQNTTPKDQQQQQTTPGDQQPQPTTPSPVPQTTTPVQP